MSDMVERVATVLFTRNPTWYGNTFGARSDAAAVIAAMREPTEGMVATAGRLNHPRDADVWRSMIDASIVPNQGTVPSVQPNFRASFDSAGKLLWTVVD